jgi:hypothetical protein
LVIIYRLLFSWLETQFDVSIKNTISDLKKGPDFINAGRCHCGNSILIAVVGNYPVGMAIKENFKENSFDVYEKNQPLNASVDLLLTLHRVCDHDPL